MQIRLQMSVANFVSSSSHLGLSMTLSSRNGAPPPPGACFLSCMFCLVAFALRSPVLHVLSYIAFAVRSPILVNVCSMHMLMSSACTCFTFAYAACTRLRLRLLQSLLYSHLSVKGISLRLLHDSPVVCCF